MVWVLLGLEVQAHGRSEETSRILNAPVPDWMFLAEPIRVEPVQDGRLPPPLTFRSRSGGAGNSRNRVQIPERGLEFQLDHTIDWIGNNEEGFGVSLDPGGTRLIVTTGMTTRLYEIVSDTELREIPIQVPYVTYDPGPKGWILRWCWAGEDLLIGQGLILDEKGHDTVESRIYIYHLTERVLARLDLDFLKPSNHTEIEVAAVGNDLEHLKLRVGDREYAVKADLKTPPKLIERKDPPSGLDHVAEGGGTTRFSEEETSLTMALGKNSEPPVRWIGMTMVFIAAVGILWIVLRRRQEEG